MRIFYGRSLAGVLTALHADTPSTTGVTTATGSTAAASPVTGTTGHPGFNSHAAGHTTSAAADSDVDFVGAKPVRVGRTTYTYDDAGRVVRTVTKRLSRKPLVHEFFYATSEQPIGFISSDNKHLGWRYIYDPYGRRVAKEAINTTTNNTSEATAHGGGHPENNLSDIDTVEQALVDAEFFSLVTDLAGSPQELIHPTTGNIVGTARHSLYGTRTWTGDESSPLLFAGQYLDDESGWAYNRFRYYNPHAGIYNAQGPLGVAPRIASAQGYVDHAANWHDYLGLQCHQVTVKELQSMPEFQKLGLSDDETADVANWLNGRNTDSYVYTYPTPNGSDMQYIGMSNDPSRRAIEHSSKFGTPMNEAKINTELLSPNADSFTRRQARAFEQAAIDSKGLDNLANVRNEFESTPPTHVKNGAVAWANGMINKGAITIPFF